MATESNTRRLVDVLLDGQLDALVQERRDQGVVWRKIAREIYDRTGVDLSHETIRGWYTEDSPVAP